jgi:hypothetical protein
MKLMKKLLQFAGLLVLLPIGTAVHAQIAGGTLFSAAPGPVTMQLLGYNVPSSVNINTFPRQVGGWETFASWVTGPGFGDWRSTRGNDPVTGPLTPSGTFGGYSGYDATVGRTISTPALAAGTLTTMVSVFDIAGTPPAAFNDGFFGVAHTGWPTPDSGGFSAYTYWARGGGISESPAMLFPGDNNTVRVGFMLPGMTASSNFLDYSVRILVGNVCVR